MISEPRILLPIDSHLPQISAAVAAGKNVIIRASPGSGKTTRVPPSLLFLPELRGLEILVLEPRRLAAKLSAERVADEWGEPVGQTIGYHFRFEKRTGPKTRLTFLTEGMLVRRLLHDTSLKGVGAVILDEFHERSLHADVALASLSHLQKTERPDLRILVMSATLEQGALAEFLGNPALFEIEAKRFELELEYLPTPPVRHLDQVVRQSVSQILKAGVPGHILVFLPGMQDIRRTAEALSEVSRSVPVYALHGELKREEQDLALRPSNKRKIILATNVAETSLTIDGVQIVIDSGLHRQARFSSWSGIPSLHTRAISKASATQRAGRAARQAPGRCYRLYTKIDFDQRPAFDVPEILRSDLSQLILEIKRWGKGALSSLKFLDPPPPLSLVNNANLLWRLGALQTNHIDSPLSAIGQKLAEIPMHPRIGRMLIEAEENGIAGLAALFCALLSEGEPLQFNAFETLRRPVTERIRRVARQISDDTEIGALTDERLERLTTCALKGFPDRVAKRRNIPKSHEKEIELLLCGGEIAKAPFDETTHASDLFVVLNVQEQKVREREWLKANALVPISSENLLELDPYPLVENVVLVWDENRKGVMQKSSLRYGVLTLEETVKAAEPGAGVGKVLVKDGLKISVDEVPASHVVFAALARAGAADNLEETYERVQLISKYLKNSGLAPWNETWNNFLAELQNKNSWAALREVDWKRLLTASLAPNIANRIDSLLPGQVQLKDRRVKVNYPSTGNPWIESRIQDFFGLKRGPAILDGSLPLALHLLAPNKRPVQVTTDLASFWKNTYPEVRKQLSRRYPRHAWPEDPTKF